MRQNPPVKLLPQTKVSDPVAEQKSAVHVNPSSHSLVSPGVQTPKIQVSWTVHPLWSASQGVPSGPALQAVFVRAGLHRWQGSSGLSDCPVTHTPSIKQNPDVTVWLHVASSESAEEQMSMVQSAPSSQSRVGPGLHTPDWQVSPTVHPLLSASHATPSLRGDHAVFDWAGAHFSQGFSGLISPES